VIVGVPPSARHAARSPPVVPSPLAARSPYAAGSPWPWVALGLGALVLLLFSLGAGLLSAPIEAWDESRNVVNALEMQHTGLSLVTTYGFHPDLWNTKPPLLIWLMVLSLRLFGPHVWALRLPLVLAGIGTLAVVASFTWRLTRSAPGTLLAALLLAGSSGFFGRHAVATGDYDALLTLLTTSYLCLLFCSLHRQHPGAGRLIAIGLLIAAAVLTKGIAGLIPGVGVVLYLLLTGRSSRPFRSWNYLLCALAALLPICLYYALREAASPGYLAAVAQNELGGRYLRTIGAHSGAWWYYLDLLAVRRSTFALGILVFLTPLGLLLTRARTRQGLLYVLCILLGILGVYSVAATKLAWYLIPAYPFMAIAMALTLVAAAERLIRLPWLPALPGRLAGGYAGALLVLAVLMLVGVRLVHTRSWYRHNATATAFGVDYGRLFRAMHRLGIGQLAVVDGGIDNNEGLAAYNPQLRFYTLLWQQRGVQVTRVTSNPLTLPHRAGAVAASCDGHYLRALSRLGASAAHVPACVAVRLR